MYRLYTILKVLKCVQICLHLEYITVISKKGDYVIPSTLILGVN